MKETTLRIVIVALCILLLTADPLAASGVIIVIPPDDDQPAPIIPSPGLKTPIVKPPLVASYPSYITATSSRIIVRIANQVAMTRVEESFANEWDRAIEGEYIFPLAEETVISNFSIYMNGQYIEGKLLSKEEVHYAYENTMGWRRNTALEGYARARALQANVEPMLPHAERRIRLEYIQTLLSEDDLLHYVCPLSSIFFTRPLHHVSIHVTISSRRSITSIYSPNHNISILRRGNDIVEIAYETNNALPDTNFVLYYTLARGNNRANLLS